jgi:hypothetical protein
MDQMTDATLNASWLAARQGVDPLRIEGRRRAGELLAIRDKARGEWRYPVWQFDDRGEVRPAVARLLELAKQNRIPAARVEQLLERKVGLVGGGRTVRELLVNGSADQALAEIRSAI